MGLFDRFKRPDYKSKDVEVRKQAVKNLTDESILVDIVKNNDEDYYVRAYALKNIKDENILKDIVTNVKGYEAKFLRRLAFVNIHDDVWLKDYFSNIKNDNYSQVCLIRSINDNAILEDFVMNSRPFLNNNLPMDLHIILTALENITDNSILLNVVNNHFSIFIREKALLKISDQNILKKFAEDDSNERLKITAIRNPSLDDKDFLKSILENEEDELICKIINNRLSRDNLQNALLTLYSGDYKLCNQIIRSDDEFINKVIANNFNIEELKCNGEISTSQEVIDIAYNSTNEMKRRDAVKEIYDKSILEDLMEKEISDTVLTVIYSKLGKQNCLKDIALLGRYDGINALKIITNPFILEDIALMKPYDSLGFDEETRIKVLKRLINFESCLDFINEYTNNETLKLMIFNKKNNRQCSHCYSFRVVLKDNEMYRYLECHDCGSRTNF